MTDFSPTILVADDDRVPRKILSRVLENFDYSVVEASNGEEAWQILLQDNPPRIAILDWIMPGIDGVELCQRLQDSSDHPFIYTILLTNKQEESDLVYALNHGAHDFQRKPANPAELRARIAVGQRLVEANDKLQESLNRMEILATIDPLTEIYNRRSFLERANSELQRAMRYDFGVAIMLFDVDSFKSINDHYGHDIGDLVLTRLTNLCTEQLREHDLFGRYGGDEFIIMLVHANEKDAFNAAERFRIAVSKHTFEEIKAPDTISISLGISINSEQNMNLQTLIKEADQALLQAKQRGRDCVVSFQSMADST